MRNRFRNPSLKEPLTRSRRNYRWDIEMGCVYVCVCVYARKTIPIPHGTRERLIEINRANEIFHGASFMVVLPVLSQISFKASILCKSNHRLPLTITTFRESDWLSDWIVNEISLVFLNFEKFLQLVSLYRFLYSFFR